MADDNSPRKIEAFLRKRTLIPVLGPGVITFGPDDTPLYPWLVGQVAQRLGIDPVPESLHTLVCEHLTIGGGSVEDVCLELDDILDSADIEPGPLLLRLASLPQCPHFFTLGFDPLFERALSRIRGMGHGGVRTWSFGLDRAPTDLPTLDPRTSFLGYLFGKVSPNPGFRLWDADAIEFVYKLQQSLPALNVLAHTLKGHNLLFMGTSCSDWLVRFLLRVIRQEPLSQGSGRSLFIADPAYDSRKDTVVFYQTVRREISMLDVDPLAFARSFCDQALGLEEPLLPGTSLTLAPMEPRTPDGSIFISYAHHDQIAANALALRLREAGCRVWLDHERLVCGDNFENHLEEAVMRTCGFFISVISATTEGRSESYFHKERKWAAKRVASMAHTRPFYFPVVIDDTPLPARNEPPDFSQIDIERAPGGHASDDLCSRLRELQARLHPPSP